MINITLDHVTAISHAELFLSPTISRHPEPRFRHEIENDQKLLKEVKQFLLDHLYRPGLPFGSENQKS